MLNSTVFQLLELKDMDDIFRYNYYVLTLTALTIGVQPCWHWVGNILGSRFSAKIDLDDTASAETKKKVGSQTIFSGDVPLVLVSHPSIAATHPKRNW